MAKRTPKNRRRPREVASDRPVVVVCRGGDCGNRTKHPGFDHVAQLRRIRLDLDGVADVVSSSCLDACDHSNVVVVLPGEDGRAAGADPVWIGRANDADTTADIVGWVEDGGPGTAHEPTLVAINAFRPNRLNRHELEEAVGTG
ncbi:hypothetical protein GCM10022197_00610 [Microlunatus spumicola]|uniref:(2Fe-2S) ferredoxin domain-containing protein n=2 Tax=Microlunatus spumicola TaxID=81499 RepID=A0ABP6WBZ0_9ACTN